MGGGLGGEWGRGLGGLAGGGSVSGGGKRDADFGGGGGRRRQNRSAERPEDSGDRARASPALQHGLLPSLGRSSGRCFRSRVAAPGADGASQVGARRGCASATRSAKLAKLDHSTAGQTRASHAPL